MLRKQLLAILLMTQTFIACDDGGNSNIPHFINPSAMMIASKDATIKGQARRLAYVTNFSSGTLAVVDVRDRQVVDLDEDFDGEETPISLGGNLLSVLEWTPASLAADPNNRTLYKILVIDQLNQRLFMLDANATTVENVPTTEHQLVDLGGGEIATAGRPVFLDSGRQSNPVISAIATSDSTTNENWRLVNRGREQWVVESNISGRLPEIVNSGTRFSSSDGKISFLIQEGDLRSTDGDIFFFGTLRAKPLALNGTPEAAALVGDTLYLADRENQEIDLLDLNTLSFGTSLPLNDGSGNAVIPTSLTKHGDKLLLTNRGGGKSIFLLNTNDATLQSVILGFPTLRSTVAAPDSLAYLFPVAGSALPVFDFATNALSTPAISLSSTPLVSAPLTGGEGLSGDGLLASVGHRLDLISSAERKRQDTRNRGDSESFSNRPLFFDYDASSNPSLLDAVTQDGVTKTENWVLVFEGVIESTPSVTGEVIGNQFSDLNANYLSRAIKVGDLLVLYPDNATIREEVTISQIDGDTALTLATTPNHQGGSIPYEIRAPGAYTIFGSLSGFQANRAVEGSRSSSDDGGITFSINAGSRPTSRNDYFTFDTDDGITPVNLDGDLPIEMHIFEGRAYLLNQGSSNITSFNISSLSVDRVIN